MFPPVPVFNSFALVIGYFTEKGGMPIPGEREDSDMAMAIQMSLSAMIDSAAGGAVGGAVGGAAGGINERTTYYELGIVQRPYVACKINGSDLHAFLSTSKLKQFTQFAN